MSLYQELRPESFEEIVGNSTTIGALRTMLRKKPASRPHAILLKGPYGCGKTTIARILAKEFGSNDESTFKVQANNTNGIETTRQIADDAQMLGLGGHVKTYIVDESHELTNRAQQGFLDILEDNPSHCYFIFCTTNPESIIEGIHNRCAEYEVNLLSRREIQKILGEACKKKDLNVSDDIIEAITLTCDGSPRAALVSLEQVSGIEDTSEALEILVSGTVRDASVIDLCKLLTMTPDRRRKQWKKIKSTFDATSGDSEAIRKAIQTFLYKKLDKYDKMEDILDIIYLLTKVFSVSTFYGKRTQLGALIVRACFESWQDDPVNKV